MPGEFLFPVSRRRVDGVHLRLLLILVGDDDETRDNETREAVGEEEHTKNRAKIAAGLPTDFSASPMPGHTLPVARLIQAATPETRPIEAPVVGPVILTKGRWTA